MLTIAKGRAINVKWPVTVNVPRDGGETTRHIFTAEFKLLRQPEIDAILAASRDSSGAADADLLDQVLVGWGADVADENGNPLPCNEDNKASLIGITYVRAALVRSYFEAARGEAAAKQGPPQEKESH